MAIALLVLSAVLLAVATLGFSILLGRRSGAPVGVAAAVTGAAMVGSFALLAIAATHA